MLYLKLIVFSIPLLILCFITPSFAKTLDYTLTIDQKEVNFSGKNVLALAINNSIPGPTLEATVGDTLRIKIVNRLKEETSIHWHGVLLPHDQDGVPYINTPPIQPGKSYTYQYKVTHPGTYWYHSHSGLQEQQGIYGSLIFRPSKERESYDEERVIVLSDWTDEAPEHVLANIKRDPDYYALKKDAVQSWYKVLANGPEAINLRLTNALSRMGPMDMSDIGYDAFLINGKQSSHLSQAKPGSKIRLRIINAAASSYFILEYSGSVMKVIESDGMKIEPFTAQRIKIAMAETYDVIVTVPDHKAYEFRATAEDGTGYATTRIGLGEIVAAPTIPKPNLVLMNMDMPGMHGMGAMNHGDKGAAMPQAHQMGMENPAPEPMKHTPSTDSAIAPPNHAMHNMSTMDAMTDNSPALQQMVMGNTLVNKAFSLPHVSYLNSYNALKSPVSSTLPQENPVREIILNLTGSMERYVWTINDTPMYAADKIRVKRGENVKMVLVNKTMMHHPIHLHGHFFRVLNGQGDYSPLKHTVNVAPYETVTIEFEANEEKDWIFHCHNLYHMKLGMGGIISYLAHETAADRSLHPGNHAKDHGNKWFSFTQLEGFSNLATARTTLTKNDHTIQWDMEHNYHDEYETEIIYQHYTSQFFGAYGGVSFTKEEGKKTYKAILGFEYTLPLLIKADMQIGTKGKARLGVHNEHQLTDRLSCEWQWNTDKEYRIGLEHALTKQIAISGNYDSKEQFGLGLSVKF